MASYQSPLLTERVPYDWEELRRVSQMVKDGVSGPEPEPVRPAAFAPTPARPVMPGAPQPAAVPPAASDDAPAEQELVERLVPKILERLTSQMEIIVDVTLDTASTRIRADLKKALETTVRMTVREELANRGH